MSKFDEVTGVYRENLLMETVLRIQEMFDEMYFTHHVNPDKVDAMDSIERFRTFCDWSREFEETFYDTDEYVSDWIELTDKVFSKKLTETFGMEEE